MFEITLDEIFQLNQRKIDTQYQFKRTLAKGSFGTVILAYDKIKHREVAVKIIAKDNEKETKIHQFKEEVNVFKKTNHPNIVDFYDCFETKDSVYIIMEYIEGGTLREYMESKKEMISEDDARQIIKYLLNAVDHLHRLGICHRDIKPANIMFSSFDDLTSLKLIDFGLSTELCDDSLTFCGTILFMPPERLMKKSYSNEIDVWSVGIITYMLFHKGKHPFHTTKMKMDSYLQTILNSPIDSQISAPISFFAKHFVQKLVEVKPSNRYLASFALLHPWISKDYTKMHKHLLDEEIEVFKKNQVNTLLSMIFLSQYKKINQNKKGEKQTEERTFQKSDSNSNLIMQTEPNINKTKTISFFQKKTPKRETIPSVIFKKPNTHLAILSHFSLNCKGNRSEHDSQSSFSSRENQTGAFEIPIKKGLTKFRVIKLQEDKQTPRLANNLLIKPSNKSLLSTNFNKSNNADKKEIITPNIKLMLAQASQTKYNSYTKTTVNPSDIPKIVKKKSKKSIPLLLPPINSNKTKLKLLH